MSAQSREVLVIGAGIAGLTAARDLAVDGYDVAVLEARERIGGRIWTSHALGLPADLGASWIHGFEDNPIARLARRHAITIVRTNISSMTPARYRSMVLYDEDGRRLSSRETAEMSEMMADYLDFVAAKQKEGREKSMLEVEEMFAASQGYEADQRRRLTFIARTYLEHEWAGSRSDVSLLEYDKSLGFAGQAEEDRGTLRQSVGGYANRLFGHASRRTDQPWQLSGQPCARYRASRSIESGTNRLSPAPAEGQTGRHSQDADGRLQQDLPQVRLGFLGSGGRADRLHGEPGRRLARDRQFP